MMDQCFVGIDMGATHVRIGVADEMAHIIGYKKRKFQEEKSAKDEVILNIINLIEEVCTKNNGNKYVIKGIGIALAATFDRENGTIIKWPNNKKWNGLRLLEMLKGYYHVPIVLEDDANAAAIGENIAGAGVGYKNLIYITVSTGIGCGIILNNRLFTGATGWAGELGHIKVTNDKIVCTCGAEGCLQAVASGPAILKRYIKHTGVFEPDLTLEQVAKRAIKGDANAIEVFDIAGTYIGRSIANIAMVLDVPLFILGGGVLKAEKYIVDPIQRAAMESLKNKKKIEIIVSENSDRNGVVGALALIRNYKL